VTNSISIQNNRQMLVYSNLYIYRQKSGRSCTKHEQALPDFKLLLFLHGWNSDFLGLFPNIWIVPHFQRIYYIFLLCGLSCTVVSRYDHIPVNHFLSI
jgi:hypothetical protein